MISLPAIDSAPLELLALEGNCGPVAAWYALRAFRRRVSAERIIRACAHTRTNGVFTIALATALHRHGLRVSFHSEPDPDPKPLERRHYELARREGIAIGQALSVRELLSGVKEGKLPIVFYDTPEGEGHFSPLVGEEQGELLLPYSQNGRMRLPELEAARSGEQILRQCVVVHGRLVANAV